MEDIKKGDDIENEIISYFLKNYSPRTSKIFNTNNITFSSMEILLPIILDNYKAFIDNSNMNYKQGLGIINDWLIKHGFVKDNKLTDKEVTTEDLRNFAVILCEGLAHSGRISDKTIGYSNLLGDLLNTKYSVSIRGVENEYSLENIFDKLRNQKYLYSSKKDIALRNIINHRFAQDTFGISKDSEGRTITFAQIIMTQLTLSWFNLIGRNNIISELSKNDFVKQNLSSQLSELNQKNINCWNFYSVLGEIYKDLVSNNISDNVVNTIKTILDKYNPDSLVFLTERLMEVSAKLKIQQERNKILSTEKADNDLRISYLALSDANKQLLNLIKFKHLLEKNISFIKHKKAENIKEQFYNNLYLEIQYTIELIEKAKPIIQRAQALVDAVVSQKQNRQIDETLLVNNVTATDLRVRDMLKNIRCIIDALGMYIEDYKDNNLANLSFDDLVKDMKGNQDINDLFTIDYVNLISLIKIKDSNLITLLKMLTKFHNFNLIDLDYSNIDKETGL